jgi:cytochrome c oxidase subunit 2
MLRKPILFALVAFALAGTACSNTADLPAGDRQTEPAEGAESTSSAQAGEELFRQLECSGCHVAAAGQVAPSLNGLFGESVNLENGETVIADEEYIRESILSPQAKIVAGYQPIMPGYEGRLSEEELEALVEYVKSLGNAR